MHAVCTGKPLRQESRDAAMPAIMPPFVEKALAQVLKFRNTRLPIEVHDAIREALEGLPARDDRERGA